MVDSIDEALSCLKNELRSQFELRLSRLRAAVEEDPSRSDQLRDRIVFVTTDRDTALQLIDVARNVRTDRHIVIALTGIVVRMVSWMNMDPIYPFVDTICHD